MTEVQSEKLIKDLSDLHKKIDKIQLTINELDAKLSKHIGFIDDTYEGLKNPISMASKFFRR